MKLAIFGAAGKVGSRVAAEAASRGHHVIPVVRDAARLGREAHTKEFVIGDVTNPRSVAFAVKGMNAIISTVASCAPAIRAGVRRLLVVGGAGSLEIAPGLQEVAIALTFPLTSEASLSPSGKPSPYSNRGPTALTGHTSVRPEPSFREIEQASTASASTR